MVLVRRGSNRSSPTRGWDLTRSRDFGSIFDEFDQFFNELTTPVYGRGQWVHGYPVDLYETGDEVVLEMAVPGISIEDLDISIEGRQLSMRGSLPEAGDQERRYWLQGIPRGEFQRTVTLPTSVEADDVQASVQNGLLVLRMPKVAAAKARRITITDGNDQRQ